MAETDSLVVCVPNFSEGRRADVKWVDPAAFHLTLEFLGAEEAATKHREAATEHFHRAAALYPRAQSPQLALSLLARAYGDRPGALHGIKEVFSLPADEEARKEYLSRHQLADLTPRTITDRPELLRRLDSSPLAPAVTDMEEYSLGTVCVAVPVYSGNTLGSLGVSLRAGHRSRLEEVTARLIPTADRVTRGLSLTI